MKNICDGGVNDLGFAKGDVQYPYALIEDDRVINIGEINKDNRRLYRYTCPGCHEEFRPRLGNKKAHCFYHYSGNRCDVNKYIHDTAELLLKQKFDSDEKFEVVMNVYEECVNYNDCIFRASSCSICKNKTIDLKKYFKECLVEHTYGEFRPDLLLMPKDSSKEPIFIEIWNKHKNSEKKANSKYKIIEIKVQSLEDLEELPKHPITESENVSFSHFDKIRKSPQSMPAIELIRYTLFENGKSFCDSSSIDKCYSFGQIKQKTAAFVVIGREMDFHSDTNHTTAKGAMRELATYRARLKGYSPKSCYDCIKFKQNAIDSNGNEVTGLSLCWKDRYTTNLAVECKQDDALSCNDYVAKDYHTDESLYLHRHDPLFIWERQPRTSDDEKAYLQESDQMNCF